MGERRPTYGRMIFIGARDMFTATAVCFLVFLGITAAVMLAAVVFRLPPPTDQVFASFAMATLFCLATSILSGSIAMLLRRFKP